MSHIHGVSLSQSYQAAFIKLLVARGKCELNFNFEANVADLIEFNDVEIQQEKISFMKFNCFEQDGKSHINSHGLLDPENGRIDLFKYINAYKEMKTKRQLKPTEIRNLVVFTNTPFNFEDKTLSIVGSTSQDTINFKEIKLDAKNILQVKTDTVGASYYMIDEKIIEIISNKKAEMLNNNILDIERKTMLENLTEEDIKVALRKLFFTVTKGDLKSFCDSIDQKIQMDFKCNISPRMNEKIKSSFVNKTPLAYKDIEMLIDRITKEPLLGLDGIMYAINMTMLLFIRAFIRESKDFVLEAEVKNVGSFDDIVLRENNQEYRFLQLKHKTNNSQKITDKDIFSKFQGPYSLIKYVCSYWTIKTNNLPIKDTMVFTNVSFDFIYDKNDKKILLKPMSKKKATDQTINNETNNTQQDDDDWYEDSYKDIKEITLEEIPKPQTDILNLDDSNSAEYYKINDKNVVKIILRQMATLVYKDVEKDKAEALLNLNAIIIEEALDHIVFAVGQPNETKLSELVVKEIKEHFKIDTKDTVNTLKVTFEAWFQAKPSFPSKITYDVTNEFFQQHVKKFQFEVPTPTEIFVGRDYEIEKIRSALSKENNIAISESTTFVTSGLGGIGKTELAKQFIARYRETDYYGRVIWIDSENENNIRSKLEHISKALRIEMDKSTSFNDEEKAKYRITQIIEYFKGMKVLFVFDNVEKKHDQFNCITYFRDTITPLKNRPHVLITTRNKEYGAESGLEHINLDVLDEKDASDLINQSLEKKVSDAIVLKIKEDEVIKLVKILHCFPLALKQATAYISRQHKLATNLGQEYTISQYINAYEDNETYKLLNFKLDVHSQTTFTTWNITFEAIMKENGRKAITILQCTPYFNADEIDFSLLEPLLKDHPEDMGEIIESFKTYSLVEGNVRNKKVVFKMHRLVQQVIRLKNQHDKIENSIILDLLDNIKCPITVAGDFTIEET